MAAMLHPIVGIFLDYIILALRDHPLPETRKITRRLSPLPKSLSNSRNNIGYSPKHRDLEFISNSGNKILPHVQT